MAAPLPNAFRAYNDLITGPVHWFRSSEFYMNHIGEEHTIKMQGAHDSNLREPFVITLLAPISFIEGAIKPILFPLIAIVGAVAFPVLAVIKVVQAHVYESKGGAESREKASEAYGRASLYAKFGVISILSTAGCVGFVLMAVYIMPVAASTALVLGAFGVSIAVHVFKTINHRNDPLPTPADARYRTGVKDYIRNGFSHPNDGDSLQIGISSDEDLHL